MSEEQKESLILLRTIKGLPANSIGLNDDAIPPEQDLDQKIVCFDFDIFMSINKTGKRMLRIEIPEIYTPKGVNNFDPTKRDVLDIVRSVLADKDADILDDGADNYKDKSDRHVDVINIDISRLDDDASNIVSKIEAAAQEHREVAWGYFLRENPFTRFRPSEKAPSHVRRLETDQPIPEYAPNRVALTQNHEDPLEGTPEQADAHGAAKKAEALTIRIDRGIDHEKQRGF